MQTYLLIGDSAGEIVRLMNLGKCSARGALVSAKDYASTHGVELRHTPSCMGRIRVYLGRQKP